MSSDVKYLLSRIIAGIETTCFETTRTFEKAEFEILCFEPTTGVVLYSYKHSKYNREFERQAKKFSTSVTDEDVTP